MNLVGRSYSFNKLDSWNKQLAQQSKQWIARRVVSMHSRSYSWNFEQTIVEYSWRRVKNQENSKRIGLGRLNPLNFVVFVVLSFISKSSEINCFNRFRNFDATALIFFPLYLSFSLSIRTPFPFHWCCCFFSASSLHLVKFYWCILHHQNFLYTAFIFLRSNTHLIHFLWVWKKSREREREMSGSRKYHIQKSN